MKRQPHSKYNFKDSRQSQTLYKINGGDKKRDRYGGKIRVCDADWRNKAVSNGYFNTTPMGDFELFYVKLYTKASTVSNGYGQKAQEYIYIIKGQLALHMETGQYTLNERDTLMFDSSGEHIYINQQNTLLSFIGIHYYPNE